MRSLALGIGLRQQPTLSLRLQHAVRLLQLSSQFAQELQTLIERNPFLESPESDSDSESPAVPVAAAGLAGHLARVVPGRFTASAAKNRRSGRIYVDYLRNDPGATAAAAFSCRARPGAPVSTPLTWEELTPTLRAADFNLNSIPERLANLRDDPWHDYDAQRRTLTKAMWAKLGAG